MKTIVKLFAILIGLITAFCAATALSEKVSSFLEEKRYRKGMEEYYKAHHV